VAQTRPVRVRTIPPQRDGAASATREPRTSNRGGFKETQEEEGNCPRKIGKNKAIGKEFTKGLKEKE
jgi:hypothetical protein